ncbi:hypothetical protein [Candidatus Mycoplasma haematohominis]|uniref:hypothetical protein n=1 Tax=Candidatus Mycoplasma haematohominis TaxID=1494318 RepID=UPI001C0A6E57|nr:hypothetical protein [Candidatus Mycoplasma haemohominis]
MFHWAAALLSTITLAGLGLCGGYFGTKEYYETHPQTLAQSKELTDDKSIAYENRNELLAINPKENRVNWKKLEKRFKETVASNNQEPASEIFKTLKTTLTNKNISELDGTNLKESCKQAYSTNKNSSNKDNILKDIKKYCAITPITK